MQDDLFYKTILSLQIEDYKSGKLTMTLQDAEDLYTVFGLITTIENGKIKIEKR